MCFPPFPYTFIEFFFVTLHRDFALIAFPPLICHLTSPFTIPFSEGGADLNAPAIMAKKRILFISQEINPYLPASPISSLGRLLPQQIHGKDYEVRTFMPRYGSVNERRNQLHEVIRLSGMNIIINDNDHPLILKVASLQPARIQVYFIDNDDYFQKLDSDIDVVGSNRPDNDERALFFARGTVETVRKLRWEPEVIHCSGWMTAINPMFLRKMFVTEPSYANCKIVYDTLDASLNAPLDPQIIRKLKEDGISAKELAKFKDIVADTNLLHIMAIEYSDGVIFRNEPSEKVRDYVQKKGIPFVVIPIENTDSATYLEFYHSLQK